MTGVIVHDWIEKRGGAEKVLDQITETFPGLDLHCLWNDDPARYPETVVYETLLARTPLRKSKVLALPAATIAWRHLRAGNAPDWALISSHSFAHHAKFCGSPDIKKLVYVHTPARYVWAPEVDTRGQRKSAMIAAPILRRLDLNRSKEISSAAANSKFIADRIMNSWNIDARIIYPPVNVEFIQSVESWSEAVLDSEQDVLTDLPDEFVLGASRLVPYKKLDVVIDIAVRLGVCAVIAGSGPDQKRLRNYAEERKAQVVFVNNPSDALLYALYQKTILYVFPPIEDFGIMPVEAMAAGAKVLANVSGGCSETVVEGETGALTDFSDAAEVEVALTKALGGDRNSSRVRAKAFSSTNFRNSLRKWVQSEVGVSS